MNTVIESLKQLDVNNDNHWTADGLPRLDTVRMIASDASLTRETLDTIAPGFNRANAQTWEEPVEQGTPKSVQDTPQEQTQPETTDQQTSTQDAQADSATTESSSTEQPAETEAQQASEVEAYETALKHLQECETKTAEALQVQADANAKVAEALQAEDIARKRVDSLAPEEKNEDVVQRYLRNQVKALEEQAELAAKIAESGINLDALRQQLQLSPLDSALSQRK